MAKSSTRRGRTTQKPAVENEAAKPTNQDRGFFNALLEIDQDQIALSILLQWIWRSRIRKGEPINLFIPSERMRGLLKEWLEVEPRVKVDVGPTSEVALEAA